LIELARTQSSLIAENSNQHRVIPSAAFARGIGSAGDGARYLLSIEEKFSGADSSASRKINRSSKRQRWFGLGMTRWKWAQRRENATVVTGIRCIGAKTMSPAQLPPQDRESLLDAARKALKRAYAPYSKFHVGAAVLTEQGEVFTGCNVENASYGLTNCAERSAIFTAVQQTTAAKLAIRAVAVVNGNELPCSPCGACRQVIFEFGENAIVIFKGQQGYLEMPIQDLLPESFRLS
jgi:cytidine deaminase